MPTTPPSSSLSSTLTDPPEQQQQPHPLIIPIRFFPISKPELNLPRVLKCGQTFRWNQSRFLLKSSALPHPSLDGLQEVWKPKLDDPTSELVEWSMACFDRTVVLRQDDHGIYYTALYRPSELVEYEKDCRLDTTYDLLRAYFVLEVSAVSLYQDWSKRDPIFSSQVASGEWDGLRVVRQESWETMISFICSANNNIPRISLMLNRLCATFGNLMPRPPLGITLPSKLERQSVEAHPLSPPPLEFYSFPSPKRLSQDDVIDKLKLLGFGYRANYVYKSSIKLCEIALQAQQLNHWPGFLEEPDHHQHKLKEEEEEEQKTDRRGTTRRRKFEPQDFLEFLASQSYEVAHSKLVDQFPGVGPKVGDCICLFGMGFVNVVPVDIHIYKIAIRDYKLDLQQSSKNKGKNLGLAKSKKQVAVGLVAPRSRTSRTKAPSSSSKRTSPNNPTPPNNLPSSTLTPPSRSTISATSPPSLTRLNYLKIQKFFLHTWGPWAGWAQQVLFLADLSKSPA